MSTTIEQPKQITVSLCDPDPGIRCEHCGNELLDCQEGVVLMLKRARSGESYLAAFCNASCANRDIRDAREDRDRGERVAAGVEEDVFGPEAM